MRKVLPVVIVLVVAMASSLVAESIVSIPDDIPGITGEIAKAPVEIDDAAGVLSFDFIITYDTALLDLSDTDIKTGSLTSSGWFLTPNVDDVIGQAVVSGFGTELLPGGSGSLLELDFHVIGLSGTSVLGISANPSGGLNEGNILASFDPGSINIVPEPSMLGLLVAVGLYWFSVKWKPRILLLAGWGT